MKLHFCFIAAFFLFAASFNLNAQSQDNWILGRGVEVFPYPWDHFTFIQPRYDRQNQKDGAYLNSYIIRATKTFDNTSHVRLELPTADNGDVFGLSDIKVRYMHSSPLKEHFYLGYGAEFTFPTATDDALGAGKWQVRPEVGLIYFLGQPGRPIGSVILGVDYRFDYAGPGDRDHISVLGIVPNIDYWAEKWYVGYYATWSYDFNNKIFDLPLDVEFGYTFVRNLTLAVEYIQPLIKKRTYNNEFAIKLRYMFP